MTPPFLYGLVGYPVKHSLSPVMHNTAFKNLGINAEYRLFEVRPEELKLFFSSLREKNIQGLNVTIPHKEKVLALLDSLSSEARLIGAVNTVKVTGERLEGFNTDAEGFLRHLTEGLRFNPQNKNIAIIGAGGASKAICVYLSKAGSRKISIYEIDKMKLKNLINHLKENFNNIEFKQAESIEGLNIKESDLLVNASPVGMKEADPCLLDEESIHKNLLVYDLIYNPQETKLLAKAKKAGARTSNGLGMLLYQGAESFEIWTDKAAPVEVMRQALTEAIKKL